MRTNTISKTLQIFLNFSLAPMALWWKISKRSLFQSKLVNICNHSSEAWEHNCENCSLALSAITADIHFHSNKIWTNISILFSEIDRALIMLAGTIDATAHVILWLRDFSQIFLHQLRQGSPDIPFEKQVSAETLPLHKKLFASVPTSMVLSNFPYC